VRGSEANKKHLWEKWLNLGLFVNRLVEERFGYANEFNKCISH
jgi:hypothetical protein